MSSFAVRLKRIREAKGISLYRLAQLTSISKQGVINLELPDADPKLSTAEKVAKALGLSLPELLSSDSIPATTPVDRDEPDGADEAEEHARHVWRHILDARDQALEGEVSSSLRELNEAVWMLDEETEAMASTDRSWHLFAAAIHPLLVCLVSYLEEAIFPKIEARKRRVTPAVARSINERFDAIEKMISGLVPDMLIAEWERQRQ